MCANMQTLSRPRVVDNRSTRSRESLPRYHYLVKWPTITDNGQTATNTDVTTTRVLLVCQSSRARSTMAPSMPVSLGRTLEKHRPTSRTAPKVAGYRWQPQTQYDGPVRSGPTAHATDRPWLASTQLVRGRRARLAVVIVVVAVRVLVAGGPLVDRTRRVLGAQPPHAPQDVTGCPNAPKLSLPACVAALSHARTSPFPAMARR